jgi:hypothetical protein
MKCLLTAAKIKYIQKAKASAGFLSNKRFCYRDESCFLKILSGKISQFSKLLFDPNKLIVFGHPIRT